MRGMIFKLYELARSSNFDGRPSLHPERKGQLNKSPLKNWVEKHGGLPTYINSIATALLRENPGWSVSRAIATAVNAVKKMCATGTAWNGNVKVSKAVRAAACTALASWERKKASAKTTSDDRIDDAIIEAGEDDVRVQFAEMRKARRSEGKEIPESLHLSDEEYMMHVMELDLSEESGEGVNMDGERWLQLAEQALAEQASLRLPVFQLAAEAQQVGDSDEFEKEILRATAFNYKGSRVEITPEMLEATVQNFENSALDYVPFQFVTDENKHSDDPRLTGGTITRLRLADDGKSLRARIKLNETAKQIVSGNPKFGVSVKLHPNYFDEANEKYYGPTLMHVAGTHRPRLKELAAWTPIKASVDDEDITIDLSDGEFEGYDLSVDDGDKKGGDSDMKINTNNGEIELSDDVIKELAESQVFQGVIEAAVTSRTKELSDENKTLRERMDNQAAKTYKQAVELAVESYATKGVKKPVRDMVTALLLSFDADEAEETIELSIGEGDNAKEETLSKWELATRILEECEGQVDLSAETGSSEDDEAASGGRLTGEKRARAVSGLADLARKNRNAVQQ